MYKVIGKVILVLLLIVLIGAGIFWSRYINKNNLIAKFENSKSQEVYLLGAFHWYHFNKWANYSMEDLLGVVENTEPDIVFLEAREETFIEYGVVDGPVDMSVIYAYCVDNDIKVEFVDWWVVDNNYASNTTNDERDDHIYENIENKLSLLEDNQKVLVVLGSGHFYEQKNRFLDNDFEKIRLSGRAKFFENTNDTFEYPESVEDIWKERSYFYAYTFPEIIKQDETINGEIIAMFDYTDSQAKSFYENQCFYCEMFSNDELYE